MADDHRRRIEERHAVADAHRRSEIDFEAMQAQLDELPMVPAARPDGDDNRAKVAVVKPASSWLERLSRWLRGRAQ